ncbi:MAG: MurR/RpiR family transcriptional regulator [Oscillospiraceae bacterium]|nr:MurR/RpiR family transcriptional regulator [Oscillospiraceae bacterium]
MHKDFMALINANMKDFSKGQRAIAKYIMENYDKAAFMTASRLGKAVDVSESTVVRFASQLGFGGYPGMQKAIQEMIRNKLTSIQRIEVTNDQIGDQDILTSVLQSDVDKIRTTLENVDKAAFNEAVDTLMSARRIFIMGVRSSATLAGFMGFYFNYLFDDVHVVQNDAGGEFFEQLMKVSDQDVIVAFSFPRYSSDTVKAVEFCRRKNVKVIVITDSGSSPLATKGDVVLYASSNMVSFVDSLVAPMSVVNAIIVAVSRKKGADVAQTFSQLEKIWEEYKVYEINDD